MKINLSSLALGNYSFSYERSLTPKISFVAGYRFMPEQSAGDMWISKEISKRFLDEDDELRSDLDKIQLSNNAVTGEFRFYTGKKPGARGFYVSVYGRYTTIKTNYIYDYETQNTSYQLPLQADMKGFGGGLMIGSQWLIAKRVTFDWYIIGAHYGKLKGDLAAVRDLSPLSASQKAELEQDIEDILVIGDKQYIDATVTDQGVTGKLNGPLAGIRGLGFNIGIAF
ncbi:DUF3575 domain-containing protein [Pontibacter sp. SGAir0037]|nr:DUF3575 domain-containing protein [Pontibacter sp. SGAir0037]